MYGFDHKRTDPHSRPPGRTSGGTAGAGTGGLLLGVNGNRILLDGCLSIRARQTQVRELLGAAGLASIHFAPNVTDEDLARLVRAFALGGSRRRICPKQMKSLWQEVIEFA